jgi:putative ATP-dependent endonuclease of OLD family
MLNLIYQIKNIFVGLKDVGKTNFLYALRYVIGKDIRKHPLLDSDFHNKRIDKPIEIIVTIDISDIEDSDCQSPVKIVYMIRKIRLTNCNL